MTRLAYRIYRLASTLNHWARRRLTRGGLLVGFGLLLTAGMATDTEQSMGYQAFGLLLCVCAAAMATVPFFRMRFTVERALPRFGTVGQPLPYRVTVRNVSRATQTGLFAFDDLLDPRPTFDEFVRATASTSRRKSFRSAKSSPTRRVTAPDPQPLPALLPNAGAEVRMELIPWRRGVLQFGGVSVARPDPFMLFRAFSSVRAPASVTILPRRYPLPPLALPGAARYQQGGVAFASSIGESEEFVSLRDYRQGDPPRHIHWRSWAKRGEPVVKEFQDEFFVRHALILDTFTAPDNVEVFEEAVSVAASFACTIDTQESLLDLLFVGSQAYCFTIGRGLAHADQMLEILASVQTCGDKAFHSLEKLVVGHADAVSGCICIFLAWDEPRRKLVRKLRSLGIPLLVLLMRAGNAQPLDAEDRGDAPEAFHEIEVGKVAEGLARL